MLWCHNLRLAVDGARTGMEAISLTNGSCDVSPVHFLNLPTYVLGVPCLVRPLTHLLNLPTYLPIGHRRCLPLRYPGADRDCARKAFAGWIGEW